jgi:hypothetical protein
VANVIIPVGTSVVYDNAVAGPVTSAVVNNGNVNFNLSSAANIAMLIAGPGSVAISNAGTITLSGINSYSGGNILHAGSSLIAGNSFAIGAPNILSNGTAINPASFGTLSSVTLPYLNISGGTTQLLSNITTAGAQTYGDLILGSTVSGTTTLRTSNANMNFIGKIDGATAKSQSLVANAGTGVITLGDSIGSLARLNSMSMTGSSINILADIITAVGQTYNGDAFIGDASYIGRTPTVGFLFSGYSSYFQYSTPAITSTIKYLNMNPAYVRTLISEDPNVTFTGTVNDLVTNTHTLLVAAIAPDASAGSSAAASINFGSSVGDVSPLYSLNAQVVVNQSQPNSVSHYVGTVSLVGNVATYSDQTYRANVMTAQAATQPGSVTFSVYDPNASITYLLPLQISGAGAGQINLQNSNSADTLIMNGTNNYFGVQNLNGANYWGNVATINTALGYVAPVFTPPTYTQPTPQPSTTSSVNVVPPASTPIAIPVQIMPSVNTLITSQPYSSVSVEISNLSTSQDTKLVTPPGESQLSSTGNEISKPADNFINIKVNIVVDGGINTIISSVPKNMFAFKVPDILISNLIAAAPAQIGTSAPVIEFKVVATLSDDKPLPVWLKFDPITKTFTSDKVPEGVTSFEVKFKILDVNEKIVGESIIIIEANNK